MVGHAHAYGLLRLPKIKETLEGDMTAFKRSDIDTAAIPYRTKADEEKRKTLRYLIYFISCAVGSLAKHD